MVLELNGIFANHSHMMLMIKWILMFLWARMETVMTGVYSPCSTVFKPEKRMIIALCKLIIFILHKNSKQKFLNTVIKEALTPDGQHFDSKSSSLGLNTSQRHYTGSCARHCTLSVPLSTRCINGYWVI